MWECPMCKLNPLIAVVNINFTINFKSIIYVKVLNVQKQLLFIFHPKRGGGIFKHDSKYHHDNWKILDFIQLTNLCQHDLIWFNIFSWLLYFYNAFLNYMIIFFEFLLTLNKQGRGRLAPPPYFFLSYTLIFDTIIVKFCKI